MLTSFRSNKSNILVWVLLVLLIVGLAGFGITTSGGTGADVARVGSRDVAAQDYARALDQERRALAGQLGRELTVAEMREFGIDRMVLGRMINDAALDNEAARLGLSSGDGTVRDQVTATPAFQSPDGSFDREAYAFALQRTGLTATEFEEILRAEATRELIAAGLQSAVALPDTAARTLLGYLGERRRFDWIRLDAALLPNAVEPPVEADLVAHHAANTALYTRPETRQIAYASATPAALVETIEVADTELRAAFDSAPERFSTPERRALDRIGFGTIEEAAAAKARLDSNAVDFDALAAERGFAPADIDQGLVAADSLDAEVRAAIFGAAGPGIVGPVTTPLGPALYRINAVLAATSTPFEAAREDLRREAALEAAKREIATETAAIEDLLAGGATIEEIAAETVMEAGTLALNAETTGGLADDPAFRALAAETAVGAETDLVALADGGVATLRVEAIEPPAPIPLAEIRDRVAADWVAAETATRLTALADTFAGEIEAGLASPDLAARLGREVQTGGPLTRTDQGSGVAAGLVTAVFAAGDGAVVVPDGDGVILARVAEVLPFDPATAENAALAAEVEAQLQTQAADDLLQLYLAALRNEAGVTVNQGLVESTLSQLQ